MILSNALRKTKEKKMSGAMERKLDKVQTTLENLTERIDELDFKLETFDSSNYLTMKLINWNRFLKTKVMLII